jgi:hypothetical protein
MRLRITPEVYSGRFLESNTSTANPANIVAYVEGSGTSDNVAVIQAS